MRQLAYSKLLNKAGCTGMAFFFALTLKLPLLGVLDPIWMRKDSCELATLQTGRLAGLLNRYTLLRAAAIDYRSD